MSYSPSDKWLVQKGRFSILIDKKATILFLMLSLLLIVTSLVALGLGSNQLELLPMLQALLGRGDAITSMILFDIRLPRIVATLIAGFALGMAGSISQTVFRNRLATPDILGINEGATLAIVIFVLFTATASWPMWLAPFGALLAVVILYTFCAAKEEHGATLLVSGICLMEFLRAIVEFLMSMGALHEVQGIYIWLQGSFAGQGYRTSLPVLIAIIITIPAQIYIARHLNLLRLQPSMTRGLGVNLQALHLISVATIAVLAALGTSIGGPVAFIAMAAPILTSSAARGYAPALWCAGLAGSALLLASDTLARSLSDTQEIASGVITRVLGGVFLLYLLIKDGTR